MAKKKYTMPASTGGLVRYFEEEETVMKLDPKVIVGIIIVFIALEIFLNLYGIRPF